MIAVFRSTLAVGVLVVALSGCANTQMGLQNFQSSGIVRMDPVEAPDSDFRIQIRNSRGIIGFDPDNRDYRLQIVDRLLNAECKSTTIVRESEIALSGDGLWTGPSRAYVLFVRCQR